VSVADDHGLAFGRQFGATHGDSVEIRIPGRIGQPRRLEGTVARDPAPDVVVDRLARSREQAGRDVLVVEDQLRIRLGALQRDTHGHLAHRAVGQAEGSAQRLRSQDDMDAESSTLSHELL